MSNNVKRMSLEEAESFPSDQVTSAVGVADHTALTFSASSTEEPMPLGYRTLHSTLQ